MADFSGKLIGLAGRARSGKDTVGQMIIRHEAHAQIVAFADPIKAICREVWAFTETQLNGNDKDAPDPRYPRRHATHDLVEDRCTRCSARRPSELTYESLEAVCVDYLTAREAMQHVGTEMGRNCYEATWIDYAFRIIEQLLLNTRVVSKPFDSGTGTSGKGSSIVSRCHRVVITDVRFPNEVEAIRRAGGLVWLIQRTAAGLNGQQGKHVSEACPFTAADVDCVIDNNSSFADLEALVQAQLKASASASASASARAA